MALRKDFCADQGATFKRTMTWRDSAGVPVDLTNYTAKFQVRPAYGSASALLDLTPTLGGAAGTIVVVATDEETGALTVPDTGGTPPELFAVYDLLLIAPDGTQRRLLEGQFIVSRRVSA
jgi:hypothetical protein